jgi:hypothetical protein
MNPSPWIVPQAEIPAWDQFPPECRDELVQALAALLLQLPQLQALEQEMSDEPQQ